MNRKLFSQGFSQLLCCLFTLHLYRRTARTKSSAGCYFSIICHHKTLQGLKRRRCHFQLKS